MKKIFFLLITIYVAIFIMGGKQVQSQTTQISEYSDVSLLILSGRWDDIIKLTPNDAVSQYAIAVSYGVKEKWENMEDAAAKADKYPGGDRLISSFIEDLLKKNPDNTNALFVVGTFFQKRDPDEAIKLYEMITNIDSKYAAAYYNLSCIYQEKGDIEKRMANLKKAISADETYISAHSNLGNCYLLQQQYNEALKCYEKCSQLLEKKGYFKGSMPGEMYNNWAWIYVNGPNRDNEKAIQLLTKAIEAYPKLPDAYNRLGLVYKRKDMYDKAIPNYLKAIELNPKMAEAHFNLGVAYYRTGKMPEAKRSFERAVELDPNGNMGRNAQQWLSQM